MAVLHRQTQMAVPPLRLYVSRERVLSLSWLPVKAAFMCSFTDIYLVYLNIKRLRITLPQNTSNRGVTIHSVHISYLF